MVVGVAVAAYCILGAIPGLVWGCRHGMSWAIESLGDNMDAQGSCGAVILLGTIASAFMSAIGVIGWPFIVKRWFDDRR